MHYNLPLDITLFPGESSLSNLDGLTSGNDGDDGISPEIVTNSLSARSTDTQQHYDENSSPGGKLEFSALLATLQPKTLQQNPGKISVMLLKTRKKPGHPQ